MAFQAEAHGELSALLASSATSPDLFKELSGLVIKQGFKLPPFAVVRFGDAPEVFVYGDIVLAAGAGERAIRPSSSFTWVERALTSAEATTVRLLSVRDESIELADATDCYLDGGLVPANGFEVNVVPASLDSLSPPATGERSPTGSAGAIPPLERLPADDGPLDSSPISPDLLPPLQPEETLLPSLSGLRAADPEPEPVNGLLPEIELEPSFDGLATDVEREFQSLELQSPELQSPELQSPELQSPELQSPELQSPELQSPELQSPELQSPELQSPELREPEGAAPILFESYPPPPAGEAPQPLPPPSGGLFAQENTKYEPPVPASSPSPAQREPEPEQATVVRQARLVLDDGQIIDLRQSIYVGRYPSKHGLPLDYDEVVVPGQHVSRLHWELIFDGVTTAVADLGSTTGTAIQPPEDRSPHKLETSAPVDIIPGTKIIFGDRWAIFEAPTPDTTYFI